MANNRTDQSQSQLNNDAIFAANEEKETIGAGRLNKLLDHGTNSIKRKDPPISPNNLPTVSNRGDDFSFRAAEVSGLSNKHNRNTSNRSASKQSIQEEEGKQPLQSSKKVNDALDDKV